MADKEEALSELEYYGTGRRKSAVARVYLRPGSGEFEINGRVVAEYFPSPVLRMIVRHPLQITDTAEKFDIQVKVEGGGASGQAGAVRHGISRALLDYNHELREKLRGEGLLTRDPRKKERKKYGQKGARARFQFSKR